jgi:hypothetical protein
MKRSLRIRFTLIFTGLTAAILIGIWCVNNWKAFMSRTKFRRWSWLMNR